MYKLPVFLSDSGAAIGEATLHDEEASVTLKFGPAVTREQIAGWLMSGEASIQVNPASSPETEYDFESGR